MRPILLVLFVGILEFSFAQPPVPKKSQSGFPYKANHEDAKVVIDFFVDLTCPDSKAAYPVMKQVAEFYGDDVNLKTFMFPLPYHRSSYLACQGAFAFDSFNSKLTYNWINHIFDHQSTLYNGATANLGDDEILGILRSFAESLGMKSDDFTKRFVLASGDIRVQWKYGCTRGVYGTPMAFVNGVDVNMKRNWSFEDWVKVIGPLI